MNKGIVVSQAGQFRVGQIIRCWDIEQNDVDDGIEKRLGIGSCYLVTKVVDETLIRVAWRERNEPLKHLDCDVHSGRFEFE